MEMGEKKYEWLFRDLSALKAKTSDFTMIMFYFLEFLSFYTQTLIIASEKVLLLHQDDPNVFPVVV